MGSISADFSDLPGDVALFLSQNRHTEELAVEMARCMKLPLPERQIIEHELIGAIAEIVDRHLDYATRPDR
jgi:hypothetical protein